MMFTHVANDAVLGVLDEIKDVLNFITHRDLLGNLDDGILKREVLSVNQTIGVGNVAQHAF